MTFRPAHVEKSLVTVRSRFNSILEPRSHSVLEKALSMLRQSMGAFQGQGRRHFNGQAAPRWGFSISPDDPLTFRETDVDGLRLRIDLFLHSYWETDPAQEPCYLTIAVRIWCLNQPIYFRPDWDAPSLGGLIDPNNGRVMLRVHFDLANEGQPGPKHHLQFGGVQHAGELNWFPETISLPRLLHTPVDLILAVELIAATFYPSQYSTLRREPLWTNCIRDSQAHLLPIYLKRAADAVSSGNSLLEELWNVSLE